MAKIYRSRFDYLPEIIQGKSGEIVLSSDELLGLHNRLKFVEQLADELAEWRYIVGMNDDVKSFIDRIELHSGLCLALPNDAKSYSWWVAHNGWRPLKAGSISDASRCEIFLKAEVPSLWRERDKFGAWIAMASESIFFALDEFYHASEFAKVWTQIVLINSVVALILSGISRQRLGM